ncbi:MAG: 2-hydroxychromene-2-carboxylate isomerase [Deltaproteobacteria bacterium]|nr:2-hydroxychromene-2-carboxylate isomerase [Deltaproteobacteria bacterium]
MKNILFYFDIISPYAWLAAMKAPDFAKQYKINLEWKPVLFAGLLKAYQNLGPAEIPAKREYTIKDTMRWALYEGLKYQGPPKHPFNPLKALRFLTAIEDPQSLAQLSHRLLHAIWAEGLDPTQENNLLRLAQEKNLDGKKILAQAQSQEIKERLSQNTQEAVRQKVFGVPSFVVDHEVFWGHDRMLHLAAYLKGKLNIDQEKFKTILIRPRGIDRKEINPQNLLKN